MIKISAILIGLVVLVTVIGCGDISMISYGLSGNSGSAPQQTLPESWKTYINPEYKFTMQYPYSGEGKFVSRDHGITLLYNTSMDILDSSTPLLISITPKNGTEDIKPYEESSLLNHLNVRVFELIHPVSYGNLSGYEYSTYNEKASLLHTNIFLDNGKQIFGFSFFDQIDDYNVDEIRKVINSIKFFD